MNIKPDGLAVALQRGLRSSYLIAGAEPLLLQESRDAVLRAAAKQGFSEREVYTVDRGFDWNGLEEAAMEQSLFSSRKIIDLRLPTGKPGNEGSRWLLAQIEREDPDVLLVVTCEQWDASSRKAKWSQALAAAGVLVEIWPVRAVELPRWIEARMRRAGLQPDEEATRLLADLAEGNLLAAQQEIDKLALLGVGPSLGAADIQASASNQSRFDAFRLGECLLLGDTAGALRVVRGLQRTGIAIQAVGGALVYLLGQLESVRLALAAGSSETSAFARNRVIRMNQPAMKRALQRVSPDALAEAFRELSRIDLQSKGRAPGDPWQTLEWMIKALCLPARGGSARGALRSNR